MVACISIFPKECPNKEQRNNSGTIIKGSDPIKIPTIKNKIE
jgi:hypothetical protein